MEYKKSDVCAQCGAMSFENFKNSASVSVPIVLTVETNIKNTFPVGTMVKDESLGRGVVVGYSSISGCPFVYFYKEQKCIGLGSYNLTEA